MKTLAATLLILITALSAMPFGTVNAQASPDNTPIIIKADGSIEPSTAPIQQSGNVYSLTGDIQNRNITVQRSGIILNGAGFKLQGPGNDVYGLAAIRLQCTNVTVFNFTMSNWNIGVLGLYDNNTIQSNIFIGNNFDVAVYASKYLITGNQIAQERLVGKNITASRNQITLGKFETGFWITNCTGLKIESNNVTFNKQTSFFISTQNSNFQVYHNNFLNIEEFTGGTLLFPKIDSNWDNGVEGNYWSDYTEKYPQASEVGNSGVGNTAYVSANPLVITDRYPLMKPYSFKTPTPPEIPEWNQTILPIIFALTLISTLIVKSKLKSNQARI